MRIKETGPLTNKTPEEFQKLINDNIQFPYFLVKKEFGHKVPPNQWDDLVSAANAGMVYAATKYDLSQQDKVKFITYASNWIRYYVNEQIRDWYQVRTNQNFNNKKIKLDRLTEKFRNEHGGENPTSEWLSENSGLSKRVIRNVKNSCPSKEKGKFFSFVSIDYGTNGDERESSNISDKISLKCLDRIQGGTTPDNISNDLKEILNILKKRVSSDEYSAFLEYYLDGTKKTELACKFPRIPDINKSLQKSLTICRDIVKSEM